MDNSRKPANISMRDEKGRLLKGRPSLNPGGRPKGLAKTIRAMLPEDQLAERFVKIWLGELKGFSGREQLEAGKWITERGYGKTPETHIQLQGELEDVPGALEVADDALAELASSLALSDGASNVTIDGIATPIGYELGSAQEHVGQLPETTDDE